MSDEEIKDDSTGADQGQGADSNPFALIQEIERILADDPEDREVGENSVEFPLPDALELIPHRYLKEVDPEDIYGETVLVTPDNLFEQLAAGKVEVSLAKLAYYIPLHLIYHAALDEEMMVELPLKKVVKAVGLDELRRRTPQEFRLYDISVFDDPFKEGDALTVTDDDGGGLVFDDEEDHAVADEAVAPAEDIQQEEAQEVDQPVVSEEAEVAAADAEDQAVDSIDVPAGAVLVEDQAGSPEATVLEAAGAPAEDVQQEEAQEMEAPVVAEEAEVAVAEDQAADSVEGSAEAVFVEDHEASPEAAVEERSEEPMPLTGDATLIAYSIDSLLEALPQELVASREAGDGVAEIAVPDVMGQLRRGVVTMSTTDVISALPGNLVKDAGAVDGEQITRLDLKQTVSGVGIKALQDKTPAGLREYDIDWMADPFAEPAEKPDLRAVRTEKKEKKEKRAAALPAQAEDAPVSSKVTVYKPVADTESELDYYELPGNININAASCDELMVLKGVGKSLADRIVEYRDKVGGFSSVFDLLKIEGVDEVRFRQMTGMKSKQRKRHRRKRLASMLKMPAAKVADLNAIAEAVARKAGFDGCLISDDDGLILAQAGLKATAESLAAILPNMLGAITHGMGLAGLKVTGTVSISVDGDLYTVQGTEHVILAARHAENMVSEADLALMRKIAKELAWLLSVRAYAGPKP